MSLSERRRLLRLAELKLAPGGTLALVLSAPGSWQSRVGPVVADLSAGRPWNPETWAYLVQKLGLSEISILSSRNADVESTDTPRAQSAPSVASADSEAEAFCVTARKRASVSGGR
jgi:hypothetical protein